MISFDSVVKTVRETVEIPHKDNLFVPFGFYEDLKKVLGTRKFYPVMIPGETGCGKTYMVEQACAELGREMIRVNITAESDEDSLMGGFRLESGNTVWHYGPVIEAMRKGAILVLDEVDLAHPGRIMCLQSVMEGKGYYLKRINEWVTPAPGFNIVATANTKGTGDESGFYIATNVLNEAFLERFGVTFNACYPPKDVEVQILEKKLESLGDTSTSSKEFIDVLVDFANVIREGVSKQSMDLQHNMATRRLVHIVNAYNIWGNDRNEALDKALSRYDDHHKKAFLDVYKSVDPLTKDEEESLINDEFEIDPFKLEEF